MHLARTPQTARASPDDIYSLLTTTESAHYFSVSEQKAFVTVINSVLKSEEDLNHLLPIDPENKDQLEQNMKSGVILCKLISKWIPGSLSNSQIRVNIRNKFDMLENHGILLRTANKIGCKFGLNIRASDILEAKPHFLLAIIWQILLTGLMKKLDDAVRLLKLPGHCLSLKPHEKVLFFFNYVMDTNTKGAGHKKIVKNFTTDISDSVPYIFAIDFIAPKKCCLAILQEENLLIRATQVLQIAEEIGLIQFITPSLIVHGNQKLNYLFATHIFTRAYDILSQNNDGIHVLPLLSFQSSTSCDKLSAFCGEDDGPKQEQISSSIPTSLHSTSSIIEHIDKSLEFRDNVNNNLLKQVLSPTENEIPVLPLPVDIDQSNPSDATTQSPKTPHSSLLPYNLIVLPFSDSIGIFEYPENSRNGSNDLIDITKDNIIIVRLDDNDSPSNLTPIFKYSDNDSQISPFQLNENVSKALSNIIMEEDEEEDDNYDESGPDTTTDEESGMYRNRILDKSFIQLKNAQLIPLSPSLERLNKNFKLRDSSKENLLAKNAENVKNNNENHETLHKKVEIDTIEKVENCKKEKNKKEENEIKLAVKIDEKRERSRGRSPEVPTKKVARSNTLETAGKDVKIKKLGHHTKRKSDDFTSTKNQKIRRKEGGGEGHSNDAFNLILEPIKGKRHHGNEYSKTRPESTGNDISPRRRRKPSHKSKLKKQNSTPSGLNIQKRPLAFVNNANFEQMISKKTPTKSLKEAINSFSQIPDDQLSISEIKGFIEVIVNENKKLKEKLSELNTKIESQNFISYESLIGSNTNAFSPNSELHVSLSLTNKTKLFSSEAFLQFWQMVDERDRTHMRFEEVQHKFIKEKRRRKFLQDENIEFREQVQVLSSQVSDLQSTIVIQGKLISELQKRFGDVTKKQGKRNMKILPI